MPFNFHIEGPQEKADRALKNRLMQQDLENQQLRNQQIKEELYPAIRDRRNVQTYFGSQDPVEQGAALASLGKDRGMTTIPGTSLQVPVGMGEDFEAQALDRAVKKASFLQEVADIETNPRSKKIYQGVADAAAKGIIAKGKELTVADTAFELNAAAFMRFADQLEGAVQKYGNFESMNPEGSAMIRQLPYEMAIAYAKIVDPSSVAREGEVAAAQRYLVPMSRTPIPDAMGLTPDSPLSIKNSTTLAAIRNQKESLRARIEAYEKVSGRRIEIPKTVGSDTSSPQTSPAASSGQGQGNFQYDPRARRLIPGR